MKKTSNDKTFDIMLGGNEIKLRFFFLWEAFSPEY